MSAYRVTNWIYGHVSSFSYHMAMLDSVTTRRKELGDTVTREQYLRKLRKANSNELPDGVDAELGLEDDDLELGTASPSADKRANVTDLSMTRTAVIVPIDDGAY